MIFNALTITKPIEKDNGTSCLSMIKYVEQEKGQTPYRTRLKGHVHQPMGKRLYECRKSLLQVALQTLI